MMLGISKKQLSSKFSLQVENMPPSQKLQTQCR